VAEAGRETKNHVLECRAVERRFGGLVALSGVDLTIDRGEIFGLVGPNGSGKTTLVNAITGFFPPQRGRILLHGRDITALAPHKVARLVSPAPSRTSPCSTA
jgi:branched-chain amino acid transport system ATP-binding protein